MDDFWEAAAVELLLEENERLRDRVRKLEAALQDISNLGIIPPADMAWLALRKKDQSDG